MNDRRPDAKSSGHRIRLIDQFRLLGNTTSYRLTSFMNGAERETAKMANRKGVFIGAYVPNHLKESLRRRAAAQRLFQVVGHICADENSFTIRHLSQPLFQRLPVKFVKLWNVLPSKVEQVYKPNSVSRLTSGRRSFI